MKNIALLDVPRRNFIFKNYKSNIDLLLLNKPLSILELIFEREYEYLNKKK